jgi:hypothetical protein
MPILNSPSVEHIKNKAFYPNVKNHWENLLLSCTYCNSRKPKKIIKLYNYYWPHLNNTFLAFDISKTGSIIVKMGLNNKQTVKAQETINLYGLDKYVDSNGGIESRYEARLNAISQALEAIEDYNRQQITLNGVIRNAKSSGFWSVWFTIFTQPEVRKVLIEYFNGTADCFDTTNNYLPMTRNQDDI